MLFQLFRKVWQILTGTGNTQQFGNWR